jgi:hypothetical protein
VCAHHTTDVMLDWAHKGINTIACMVITCRCCSLCMCFWTKCYWCCNAISGIVGCCISRSHRWDVNGANGCNNKTANVACKNDKVPPFL